MRGSRRLSVRLGAALVAAVFCPAPCAAQIRSTLELRSLSAEQADLAMPVDLEGVVVFVDPPSTVFFQDAAAGAFFQLGGREPPAPGDEVRVRGTTYPGLFLPGIRDAEFEVRGHAGLPEAIAVGFEDLLSGRYHYQRVAVGGIVRTLEPEEEGVSLVRLDLGSRVVPVRVQAPLDRAPDLVDARVRVAGLAAGELNHRRQLVEPYLRCRDWSDFEILAPPRPKEAIGEVSPEEILNFAVGGSLRHLVRVGGEVLAAFPEGEVFLRSGETGVGLRLLGTETRPEVGDRIEVLGFPEMDRFSARLVDASVVSRKVGTEPPPPRPLALPDLLDEVHDGDLVAVEAELAEIHRGARGATLTLREGTASVQAEAPELPGDLATGARVRIAGIAVVEAARRSSAYRVEPERVVVLLRGPGDLAVLRAPSWWTPRRLAGGLVVFLVATVLAGLWIVLLQRQVAGQTSALRRRIEREAALEERQRLAREFHDTLEQQLAGLSLRLDAATAKVDDGKVRGFLEGARRLVLRIQTETRDLVSDLRQDPDEATDLGGALADLVEQGAAGAGPELVLLPPPGDLPPLPSRTVHHLRMIAQESLTNAMKHAGADRIALSLAKTPEGVAMTIQDDGVGFDAERETSGKRGHFGCMGMRERCRRIGAEIAWRSAPGEGCAVVVTLPNPQESPNPKRKEHAP